MSEFEHGNKHSTRHMNVLYRRLLCVRDRRHSKTTHKRATSSPGWPGVPSSTPSAAGSGPPAQRATSLGDPLRHCARTAFGHPSHIAHTQLSRAHRPPSVAASTRCPARGGEQHHSFFAISGRAVGRAARACRGHARRPLGAHAPRAGASASPGAADGRSVTALKRDQAASAESGLISLASKSS
jgi:hypothetical protein